MSEQPHADQYTLALEDAPSPDDVMELYNAIVAYNTAQVGDHWTGRLNIFARDRHGTIVGGIYGFTDRGWLRIEVLLVKEGWRRQGLGARLLAAAEAEARAQVRHSGQLFIAAARLTVPIVSIVLRRAYGLGAMALAGYFDQLFEERRRSPQDDLVSGLVAAEEEGDRLSADELRAITVLLFIAGHETTMNLIGNGTYALLRNPDQLRRSHVAPPAPDGVKSAETLIAAG